MPPYEDRTFLPAQTFARCTRQLPDRAGKSQYGLVGDQMESWPDQLIAEGYKASQQGRWQDARGLFASAIESARDPAGPEVLTRALTGFGKRERNLGNLESAVHYYSQAAEILQTLPKPLELAH